MNSSTRGAEDDNLPVWARCGAFDEAPSGFGWVDFKGGRHRVASRAELIEALSNDREGERVLVWSPDQPRMVLPEELAGADCAVNVARRRRVQDQLDEAMSRLRWMSLLLVGWTGYLAMGWWEALSHVPFEVNLLWFIARQLLGSMSLGLGLLGFLVFAFIPWYQARKRIREMEDWSKTDTDKLIPILRFETWLDFQKAPFTRGVAVGMALVGMAQWIGVDSIDAAGLVKSAYGNGQWWRLLTAPWLHGNVIHFAMNAMALLYLGKRVEVFARWPHLLAVLLFSSLAGGILSASLIAKTSVGISGGLMGWLGFLLVFESLHDRLVPISIRRRLLAAVLLTAVIGLLGYRYIDNAAHAGGMLAGMVYGFLVFPKSNSMRRPSVLWCDRLVGGGCVMILVAAVVWAVLRILGV